jgi:hypothetical protein
MAHVPDSAVLDLARKEAGWTLDDLWLAYFQLGGKAHPLEFEAFFARMMTMDPYQYNIIAHALNEHFNEIGLNHPVRYLDRSELTGSE